jgi:F420-dependent oxidoreductase-like protein
MSNVAPMKITSTLNYARGFRESVRNVVELEKAGLDMIWVAEAYGFDSPSLMGMIAGATTTIDIASGILSIYSRTPSLLAMTAAGLDELSEGRFHLGIGASGPQVVEGFHGVQYQAPIGRTKEIVDICRLLWQRDAPLVYDGKHYQLPLPFDRGTGLGKPLKLLTHPFRRKIPIWLAALGEKNVELAAEHADGWIPHLFVPELAESIWGDALSRGGVNRSPDLDSLLITAGGLVAIGEGEEVVAVRERARSNLALYIGGMGARGKNFYYDVAARYGFESEAHRVQELFLNGRKEEAEAHVPAELVERTTICGPRSYVAERIAAYRSFGVTHMKIDPVPVGDQSFLDVVREVREIVG